MEPVARPRFFLWMRVACALDHRTHGRTDGENPPQTGWSDRTEAIRIVTAALVTLGLGLASTASAQGREGFWFQFDAGVGSIGISAGNFDDSPLWTGVSGLALGWAVSPQVLVGLDLRVTPVDIRGPIVGTVGIYNVGGRVAYYPSKARGLFVKGTIGGSFSDLEVDELGTTFTANIGKGLGGGAGAGYDWYLGHGFSLTPSVTYWFGQTGDFRLFGQTLFPDWSQHVIDLTIGVSFH